MQAKAFEKSMYYPMLANVADDVRFRLVPIELKCCSCGAEYERGLKCAVCGTTFNGEEMRRKVAMRLMWSVLNVFQRRMESPGPGTVPIYVPDGRAHCNARLVRWVPSGLQAESIHKVARLNLPETPKCSQCSTPMITDTDRVGAKRSACPNCHHRLEEELRKTEFTCGNNFTISRKVLNEHRYCPHGHDLAVGVTIDLSNRFRAAVEYERLRQHACQDPQCGAPVPRIPWCPTCRYEGMIPMGNALVNKLTIVWISGYVRSVPLDKPGKSSTMALGLPEDFPFDARPEQEP